MNPDGQDPPAPAPTPVTAPEEPAGRPLRSDLKAGGSIVLALAVIGALLGLVWAAWSPPGSAARITPAGRLQDETEAWVAADGRFLVLSVAAGLVAALAAWRRRDNRGGVVLTALALGSLAGSLLMWFVGWLAGGGSDTGQAGGFIPRQRLSVHMDGLLFLQAGTAVLIYGLLVAFAARDDLGRPDEERDQLLAAQHAALVGAGYPPPGYPPPGYAVPGYAVPGYAAPGPPYPAPPAPSPERPRPYPSVGAGAEPQDSRRDGDAAGPLQQRDLPPQ